MTNTKTKAKVYEVLIESITYDRMYIEADSEQNARTIAQELVDNGTGARDFNTDIGSATVTSATVCTTATDQDKAQAADNRAEYFELN